MPDTVFPLFRAWGVALAIVTGTGAAVVLGQTAASRFALATVADPKGKAVVDISADDFVVEEAGAGREILDARIADYPVVLVLDNGGEARTDFEAIRVAATRFIERMGPRPVAIVTTAPAAVIATFDEEREALLAHIAAIEAPGTADGQPLRATALAATKVRETGALFSAIVVATASPVEVSGTAADELVTSIVDSHAVLHIVANDRGVATTAQFLRGLAQQTHGAYTAIFASPSYQPAIDRIVTRLTTELLIEYLVPPGSTPRDVRIGVRIPGARVRGLGVAPR